jgi:hypothetical protein
MAKLEVPKLARVYTGSSALSTRGEGKRDIHRRFRASIRSADRSHNDEKDGSGGGRMHPAIRGVADE